MKKLLQQSATHTGDLAAVHKFLCDVDGGEDLRKAQPSWYYDSLSKNTSIVKL